MNTDRFLLFLIGALAALSACADARDAGSEPIEANLPTVQVGHPERRAFEASLKLSGTAEPNRTVRLYAMTPGFLRELRADIGDFVKAGQVLAVLENPDLESEKVELAAEMKARESIYFRLKDIVEKTPQLTTLADVDRARGDYESTKARLQGIVTRIGFLTVRAPFSGVITRRFADKGAAIQSGLSETEAMALFDLQDLRTIRLRIDVPETDAARIDRRAKAQIRFPELPKARFEAGISRLAYGLDPATRTMRVEIDLDNPDYRIRSGMYARVEIQPEAGEPVLAVPNEAVGNIKGRSFVYLVEDGTVKKVEIRTGRRDEQDTEVLGSSIEASDTIVVRGKELVSDGAKVRARSS